MDATGRYRILWGDFADLAQALRKPRRYLDDTMNWSPEDSPYSVVEMAREGRLKFLDVGAASGGATGGGAASVDVIGGGRDDDADADAAPSTSAPLYPWEWRSASGGVTGGGVASGGVSGGGAASGGVTCGGAASGGVTGGGAASGGVTTGEDAAAAPSTSAYRYPWE